MSRHQHKNTIQQSQDNISPPEPSNPTATGHEKCNIAKAQGLQTVITNMLKDLEDDMNKFINEVLMHKQKVKGNEENSSISESRNRIIRENPN